MFKAFLGLWAVVFLPLFFLLFPSSYSPITILNEYTEKNRYVGIYEGTFYLIANRLDTIDENLWKDDVQSLSKEFGYGLSLKRLSDWQSDITQYQSLNNGEFVFINDEPELLIKRVDQTQWVIVMDVDSSQEENIYRGSKGSLYLLQQEFKLKDKDSWSDKLVELNTRFAFKLSILPKSSLTIEQKLVNKLSNYEMIWLPNQNERLDFYFLLPDSTHVIKAEEIHVSGISPIFIIVILLVFVLIISIAMFLWVSPLWKDLSKLNIIATKFGDGALDERALITKNSTVSQLTSSFNKMANKIEQLFSNQKELTRAIAHDLRTPLYRLRFAFEMIKSDDATQNEKTNYFDAIDKSIDDLDQLINQTLVLSRYNNTVDLTSFENQIFAKILQEEVDYFKLESPSFIVDLNISDSLINREIFVDKRAMIRAINNLTSNAKRFATKKISINFYANLTYYFLSIEDDGPGIPASKWENVFAPFSQLNNEQRESGMGHGLGLAIVKQIMKWHEGEVKLSDSALGGAKFVMLWPISQ